MGQRFVVGERLERLYIWLEYKSLCQWPANTSRLTGSKTVQFPIKFNEILTLINVGLVIVNAGEQSITSMSNNGFSTKSSQNLTGTNSYLAIGI